jgi:hypothetical protein
MPISCVSRTPSWHWAQVVRASACTATEELGSMCALMLWMPWQSVHTGACPLPRCRAWPWMLVMNCCDTSWWHRPQVAGTLNLKMGDLASLGARMSWAR